MVRLVPIEVVDFVHDEAAKKGLSVYHLKSEDPTTLMLFQPMDMIEQVGPSGKLVGEFVTALNDALKLAHLPLPIHIEVFDKMSALPFGITENLPDRVHLVRVSTLE
jgi:hypothetical protein